MQEHNKIVIDDSLSSQNAGFAAATCMLTQSGCYSSVCSLPLHHFHRCLLPLWETSRDKQLFLRHFLFHFLSSQNGLHIYLVTV